MAHPILYSLQNCPYALRARICLLMAKQTVELRAIKINHKPTEMLAASAKGTVPTLVLNDHTVIDESLDIMLWALRINDPCDLLLKKTENSLVSMLDLIHESDNEFVGNLKKYKSARRYHDGEEIKHRQECEIFILKLEEYLQEHDYLMGNHASLADYAILPFIRQFAKVDRHWYLQAPYPKLQHWLKEQLQSQVFSQAMVKYPLWLDDKKVSLFPY